MFAVKRVGVVDSPLGGKAVGRLCCAELGAERENG
jgi:hypothetical protein